MNSSEMTLTYEAPMRGDTLADQVYRQLCNAILAGTYAPLERINIRRLADELNVSVTPAREAVLRLVADGVLEVNERSAVLVPERPEAEIAEIFEIRRTLEGEMAQAAAPLIDEADIRFLEGAQQHFLEALDRADYRQALRYNSEFHFRIYRHASSPVRLKITESLWLRIGPTLRYMYPLLHRNRTDHRRHEDIIEAATQRDAASLRAAIIGDLDSSEIALNQYIREHAQLVRGRRAGRPGR